MGGVKVKTCIDSGSTFSLLADSVYNQLKQKGTAKELLPTEEKLKGASGRNTSSPGGLSITF